jgi:hypothetical protein
MRENWIPDRLWQPPPRCVDPRDNVPPNHDPPAKRDFAELWLRICRERLHGRDLGDEDAA